MNLYVLYIVFADGTTRRASLLRSEIVTIVGDDRSDAWWKGEEDFISWNNNLFRIL